MNAVNCILWLKSSMFHVRVGCEQCRISQVEDIDQIGTSFAVETNRRDEDADM